MDHHPARNAKVFLIVIPLGMALNLVPGLAALAWHLPLFLDAFGTIAFTVLCGWRVGAVIGVLSAFAGGMFNPHLPWFAGTHLAVALTTAACAHRGGFRSFPRVVATGLIIGVIAALVSAPAVPLAFGTTPADPSAMDRSGPENGSPPESESPLGAILSGTGNHLQLAFLGENAWIEPADKILQCLGAWLFLLALPLAVRRRMETKRSFLKENKLI